MKRNVFVVLSILIMGMLISNCALFGGGALSTPQNLSASDGTVENRIVITWDPVDGADSYNLQRSSNTVDFVNIDFAASSPYTDTNIIGSDTNIYYYRVAAVRNNGTGNDPTYSDFSSVDSGYVGIPADIALSLDTWVDGFIESVGSIQWYYFNAVSNNNYTIYWLDDLSPYYSTYTNWILVSAYRSNKLAAYFTNQEAGYYNPETITALDDTVYLLVESPYVGGNFAIKVSNH